MRSVSRCDRKAKCLFSLPSVSIVQDIAAHLTTEMALKWANVPKLSRSSRAKRLSAVRCFARYLSVRDGRTEVPGRHLVPKVCFRQRPHLYSQRELEQLLAAAGRLWPSYPLKRLVYRTLFGLLACAGLRVSEALKLNAADVDLEHGVLRIEKPSSRNRGWCRCIRRQLAPCAAML